MAEVKVGVLSELTPADSDLSAIAVFTIDETQRQLRVGERTNFVKITRAERTVVINDRRT